MPMLWHAKFKSASLVGLLSANMTLSQSRAQSRGQTKSNGTATLPCLCFGMQSSNRRVCCLQTELCLSEAPPDGLAVSGPGEDSTVLCEVMCHLSSNNILFVLCSSSLVRERLSPPYLAHQLVSTIAVIAPLINQQLNHHIS